MGLWMLDLLGRWSSEVGEEDILIDAMVVERAVGEVMVAAVMVGGLMEVKLDMAGAHGTIGTLVGACLLACKVIVDS